MSAVLNYAKGVYAQPGSVIGALFFVGVLICLILVFKFFDPKYVLISFIPFLIVVIALLLVGASTIAIKIPDDIGENFLIPLGIIVAVVIITLFIISHACLRIRPVELFQDNSEDKALKDAETEVCKLVTEANNYIQANVGIPGIDKPELVTDAQQKAVTAASTRGPILGCPVPPDNEGLQPEERLDRMDRTLDNFVEPEIKKACIKAGICVASEGFEDPPVQVLDVPQRIKAILTKTQTIKVQYLDPMKQKQADLQSGKASDSDKQQGASTVTSPS